MRNSLAKCLQFIFQDCNFNDFSDDVKDLDCRVVEVLQKFGLSANIVYEEIQLPKDKPYVVAGKSLEMQKIFAVAVNGDFVYTPAGEPITEEFYSYFSILQNKSLKGLG